MSDLANILNLPLPRDIKENTHHISTIEKVNSKKIIHEPQSDLDDIDVYPDPIDPNTLLLEIEHTLRRFIVCQDETITAAVLWIAMTWFIDVIHVAPLAVITAPEKRCGKSQFLFLLGRLVKRPLPASNISPAALFRAIDKWNPTMLIDEADTFMKDNEELRGILNCGHTRDSAFIVRIVGKDHQPHKFNAWGAKALASIGHLPNTIMDRAITLELRRKLPYEHVERLRHVESNLFQTLQTKLARFSLDYHERISSARPILPENLHDREQDNWEPLLAIADIAGHHWPERARVAALHVSENDSSTTSLSSELLTSIKDIFESKKIDRISSADLITALCADEEQPWATLHRGGPMTARHIANMLKEYNIKSKSIRIGPGTPKGFEKAQFNDVFSRYLSSPVIPKITCHTEHQIYPVADHHVVAATKLLPETEELLNYIDCCAVADNIEEENMMDFESWYHYCTIES